MKKLLKVGITLLILFTSPFVVMAQDEGVKIEIPVEVNDDGIIEIIGNDKLPDVSTLKGSGVFEIVYDNARPEDVYHYVIKQVAGENPFTIYDTKEYDVTVYIKYEEGTSKLYGIVIISQGDETTKPDLCKFENEKIDLTPVRVNPSAKKIVEGKEAPKEKFTFLLSAKDESNPMPLGSGKGIKKHIIEGEGEFKFGEIEFKQPGEYSYAVYEEKGDAEFYVYDESQYNLKYVVDYKDNELFIKETIITKAGQEVSQIEFINKYEKPSKPVKPEPEKPSNPPIVPPRVQEFVNTSSGVRLMYVGGLLTISVLAYLFTRRYKKD